MDAIYIFIMFGTLFAEILPFVNTAGFINKIRLFITIVGAVCGLAGGGDSLLLAAICVGISEKLIYYSFVRLKQNGKSRKIAM